MIPVVPDTSNPLRPLLTGEAEWRAVRSLADGRPPAVWELHGRPTPEAAAHEVAVAPSPLSVGRHPDNKLCLVNPTVSGRHAEVVSDGPGLLVRDLGSTNGTFVNGQRITGTAPIADGDVVQFGTARYTLRRRSEAAAGATVAADAAGYALAHVQFDKLISVPAVTPFFQPVVRMSDAERVGYEVLARSRLVGLETPGVMFRVAEERCLEPELSGVLRREGLRLGRPLGNLDFYLNTHPAELDRPGLMKSLVRLRAEYPDMSLMLEIHEAAVTSSRSLAGLRSELRDLGIRLAYDDFGAGQSRLAELADVPPDVIKFDMHLIRGLPTAPPERWRLVDSLVRVVRDLGVVPLAEGVETAEEAAACRELGFELAQGYFFGWPAPAGARKA